MIIIKFRTAAGSLLTILFTIGTLIYILAFPIQSGAAAQSAVEVCIHGVIPSLFSFIVLTKIIVSSGMTFILSKPFGKLFHLLTGLPAFCSGIYLLSFLSGFPSGAIAAADLFEQNYITRNDAQKLCAVCNNTGPALPVLLIGAKMLHNTRIGFVIYLLEILSSVITCLIFKKNNDSKTDKQYYPKMHKDTFRAVTTAVEGSLKSIALMCAYIILFTVVTDTLSSVTLIDKYTRLLRPFIEVVSGSAVAAARLSPLSFTAICSAVAFGGLCVHMQTASVCTPNKIKLGEHLLFKTVQAIVAAILSVIYIFLFNNSIF